MIPIAVVKDWMNKDDAGRYSVLPDQKILLQGWARDGLTEEQIAKKMHIAYSTFKEWKRKYPAFSAAIKTGREVADYAVENALFKKALSGDVGAICFYLKNRCANKWRDKPEDKSKSDNLLMKELIELNKAPPPPLDEQEGGPQ